MGAFQGVYESQEIMCVHARDGEGMREDENTPFLARRYRTLIRSL